MTRCTCPLRVNGCVNCAARERGWLDTLDPSCNLRYALQNLTDGNADRYAAAILTVRYLFDNKRLRDPAEPPLAEIREKVLEMMGHSHPDSPTCAVLGAVLALLEPRKSPPSAVRVIGDYWLEGRRYYSAFVVDVARYTPDTEASPVTNTACKSDAACAAYGATLLR